MVMFFWELFHELVIVSVWTFLEKGELSQKGQTFLESHLAILYILVKTFLGMCPKEIIRNATEAFCKSFLWEYFLGFIWEQTPVGKRPICIALGKQVNQSLKFLLLFWARERRWPSQGKDTIFTEACCVYTELFHL